MKRRQFIRNMGLAGLSHRVVGKVLASEACCHLHGASMKGTGGVPSLKLLQGFSLSEMHGEREEGPCLVTNGGGQDWHFSLRRLPYPKDKELVSAFCHGNGEWAEKDPVFPEAGQYEAITASRCRGAKRWSHGVAGNGTIGPSWFHAKSAPVLAVLAPSFENYCA